MMDNEDGSPHGQSKFEMVDMAKVNEAGKQKIENGGTKSETRNISSEPDSVTVFLTAHNTALIRIRNCVLLVAYLCYYGYAMYYEFGDEPSIRMTVFTAFGILYILWGLLLKTKARQVFINGLVKVRIAYRSGRRPKIFRWVSYILMTIAIVVYVVIFVAMENPRHLMSLVGIASFGLVMFLISNNKRKIKWHTVYWAMSCQFLIGLFVLKTSIGSTVMLWFADRLSEFSAYSQVGSEFVFGKQYAIHRFAFQTMPTLIVFCSFINMLVYIGAIQFIVRTLGGAMAVWLDVTPPEAINAVSNILLGGGEATMMIYKYLPSMPNSGLFTILTNGMASCGGAALIQFMSVGVPATYLLTASAMSAPAALACAKIIYPDDEQYEVEESELKVKVDKAQTVSKEAGPVGGPTKSDKKEVPDADKTKEVQEDRKRNQARGGNIMSQEQHSLLEAMTVGAQKGVFLVVNVITLLIVFLSFTEMIDATLIWFGQRVGVADFSLNLVLSYLFYPFAYAMGVVSEDCLRVSSILGLRIMSGPLVGYIQLSTHIKNGEAFRAYTAIPNSTWTQVGDDVFLNGLNQTLTDGFLSTRSEMIATYALCGFSSFATMGMAIGANAAFVPDRIQDITKMVGRAVFGATLASYLTACVAGLLAE